jgi:ubiquinone/menaquinone biosynthesis C-methylase UbiE
MLLNRAERALMNNPIRKGVQSAFEAGRMLDLGGPMEGGTALEIGCGRGVGVELILERFGADRVVGLDLDPRMVDLASRRLAHLGDRARFVVGDITAIDAPDGAYDAIFDFGIIHHVPDWRLALRELHRVLRPGGTFYGEEVWQRFLSWRVVDLLLEHPREDRFDPPMFHEALADVGFEVIARKDMADVFGWFVARRMGL